MRTLKQVCLSTTSVRLFIFSILVLFAGCDSFHRNKSHASVPLYSIKEGKALAEVYCQSCHALPDPSLLNAASWENGVLPNMGPRLGIFRHFFQSYPSSRNDINLEPNFYPAKPLLTPQQWQNIINYYTASSPDSLPQQQREQEIRLSLPLFEVQTPALHYSGAMTSFVKIKEGDSLQPLTISDAVKQKTYFFNKALQPTDSFYTSGPVVGAELFKNAMLACNIGVMNPNNGAYGKASYINKDEKGWREDSIPLFKKLQRPVQISPADFNGDGKTDFLICEFGYLTGSLCWMEGKGSNNFQRHVLRAAPGAAKAYIQDYNGDGNLDIWVLFAQGDEGIFLYTNRGDGTFSERQVLRFPPAYGSSYFELADFNSDGFPDIVYTCGDNADYSIVQKPYHGVYIFINDKKARFAQKYFFPIHGCYKAIARDFDKDGDLDLATISYFADYAKQPEEGFVYLQNGGSLRFQPYSLEAAKWGRWLTMDAGDIDGDGWTDLVLGNFCLGPTLSKSKYDWRAAPPFILLKNKGGKQKGGF